MQVLDSLPQKVIGIVLSVIAILILLQQIDLVTGHLNGLYLQLSQPGHCLVKGEPFDRVLVSYTAAGAVPAVATNDAAGVAAAGNLIGVIKTMNNNGTPWPLVAKGGDETAFSATNLAQWLYVKEDGTGCVYDTSTTGSYTVTSPSGTWDSTGGNMTTVSAGYTPQATSIGTGSILDSGKTEVTFGGVAKLPTNANNTSITQTDGWLNRASFLSQYQTITGLLASLFGLGIPLGLMLTMGSIGGMFVDKLIQGGSDAIDGRIGQIVVIVVVIVIATSVFGLITGGIQLAVDTIDPHRFAVYDSMIGRLASTATGFWSLMLIASFLPIGFALFRNRGNMMGGN